jgi:thymidylate synthase
MENYLRLLRKLVKYGRPHDSRAGKTRRIWGEALHFNISELFPLLTTRRINYLPVLGELAAFLEGTEKTARFEELGCNYWRPNAEAWQAGGASVGRIYGSQWRDWNGEIDQLTQLVDGLRDDPGSRRHLLTAWNPSELHAMCLPPCHVLSQYSVDGDYLDSAVYMRSVDVCLGLPSDMVLYAALTGLLAKEIGRKPGDLVFFLADCHVYENHIDEAMKQCVATPGDQPTWRIALGATLATFKPEHIIINDYVAQDRKLIYKLNV